MRALVLAVVGAAGAAIAQPVQRCEDGRGHVTYSNAECPPGTQAARTLPRQPAPPAADQQAAQARIQRYTREVERLEAERRRQEEKEARQRAAVQEKARRREAHCRRLAMRVENARQDFERATLAKRHEANRKLRRAQQQYDAACKD
ncbi:MAG: DUF4124 domain-containing protein [Sutterellaceae bacterium]|nr:DUF4124 domain-containing protein [Burkholderiaceae bacterium]MCX7901355.1 DUF4124 domain-containing protein [Burkholderiaceae bacterium]MDW8429437.1 DUF4124 domain-containing protein [Sutterellaceae bacterium]